jgi:MtfA peptidase
MPLFKCIRRFIIRRQKFPESWQKILDSSVPYYRFLPSALKDELRLHLPVLLHEKIFEGCGGLSMTEEKKVIIAAYATILILGEPAGYYPSLKTILLYPDNYLAPFHEEDAAGIMTEGTEPRSGESWDLGSIVLNWKDIERDIHQPFSGQNLIFHEFSHQLDDRYGITAGIDESGKVHIDNEENEILAQHYRDLRRAVQRRQQTLLDPYGATHPAEFFAVATECFFDDGYRMQRHHPKLYDLLKKFYNIDPASYLPLPG